MLTRPSHGINFHYLSPPSVGILDPSLGTGNSVAVYAELDVANAQSLINGFSLQDGNTISGWTNGISVDGFIFSQPLIADISGDNILESVFQAYPPIWYEAPPPIYNKIAVINHTGDEVTNELFPIYLPRSLKSNPLINDIDGDGNLELLVQTQDEGNNGAESQLYVYELDTPSGPGKIAWGEYAHDSRRSGNYHGDLRILNPTTAHFETVGPFDDPGSQALLLVRAQFTRGTPVSSTDPASWKVTIGTQNAGIREVVHVQSEHWLLVEPVNQPVAGTYTLRVEFDDGGILTWDAYRDAVRYEPPAQNHTQIAVIDTSGSMNQYDKIEAARIAARFFAESAYPADEVGIVSFNSEATDILGSGVVNADANRNQIADAISALDAWGMTSIGAGIEKGIAILNNTATSENIWGMLLLSDGLENTEPYWSNPGITKPPVRPQVETLMASHSEFMINTVALGPDADQNLLQEIADFTGGSFYPVYLGSSLSLINRLADVYHYAREKIDNTQRILTHGNTFPVNGTWEDNLQIAQGTRRLQFGLNWNKEDSIYATAAGFAGMPISTEIHRPDGTPITLADPDITFVRNRTDAVLTVRTPEPGEWKVRLFNTLDEPVEALLAVSAYTPVRVGVHFGPLDILKGVPVSTLLAYVTDKTGFVHQTDFNVAVVQPDKKVLNITLRDDGKNGDGIAGDGIYAAPINWRLPGSYLIRVAGQGKASIGPFKIIETVGFFNRPGTDRDADGIPDKWEQKHAPDCKNGLNPRGDPDGDGLDNISEWRFESDPFRFDTDGDGISDGEEFKAGTDPNDKSQG